MTASEDRDRIAVGIRKALNLAADAPVLVCLTKCEPCMFGSHYEPPQWHPWAGAEDIEHAAATGQPDPSESRCGCDCADEPKPEVPA